MPYIPLSLPSLKATTQIMQQTKPLLPPRSSYTYIYADGLGLQCIASLFGVGGRIARARTSGALLSGIHFLPQQEVIFAALLPRVTGTANLTFNNQV